MDDRKDQGDSDRDIICVAGSDPSFSCVTGADLTSTEKKPMGKSDDLVPNVEKIRSLNLRFLNIFTRIVLQ